MKGRIALLTGGGDAPGTNMVIRAITERASSEGYKVIGIKRGWGGLVNLIPDKTAKNRKDFCLLNRTMVIKNSWIGGTFLHTSRTLPSKLPLSDVPQHLTTIYQKEFNDVTPAVLKNLDFLGIDYLIVIGGDDTLFFAVRLLQEGVKVIGIPKTMDGDVFGTDYTIGFSTCVTRTIELINQLRTVADSHERILVVEVFGRDAGFTAIVPAMAGVCDRVVIPEYPFDINLLTKLLVKDRRYNPSHSAVVIVSEGARLAGDENLTFLSDEEDQFGNKKLGGIGNKVGALLKELSPRFNHGQPIDVIIHPLRHLVRSGPPDPIDALLSLKFGNIAMNLVMANQSGKLVNISKGEYGAVPLEIVIQQKKQVDVRKYYDTSQLRPIPGKSLFPYLT